MYAVNASIPKTLVRYLVAHEASQTEPALSAVLRDVLDTPVSPELLPPEQDGTIAQKTEELDNFSKKEQKNEIQCRKI